MVTDRIRVLMSAYACEPNKGSEPGVGWNWALQMAKWNEVYVITRANNREAIEAYKNEHPMEHIHFYYHDCIAWKKKMKKLPNGIFVYYKMWQKEIFPLAEKIVREEKIDIVHHVTFNEFRTPGKLYHLPVPFVWGPIGGGQFYNPVLKDAYYKKKDILKEWLRNLINKWYLLFSHDIKAVVKNADTILIADQSTEKVMPHTRAYIRLLETGYDLSRNGVKSYSETVVISRDRPIRLLWVGGIWPRKGLKVLIDALHSSKFENYSLDIVGNGQDFKASEKLVREFGLESKVHFLGPLSYNEVNNMYDNADVFVFTSLRDTSGNVVLEAMSHGLPVIAINHHGVGEIVTEETGIRIDPISYNSLKRGFAEAIERYAKEPQLMKQHGLSGRKRLEECYSWEHNAKVLQNIYEGIAEKSDIYRKR
ncbi:MAG: glycosyltransferase family 4 protein [Coprococcus sp.]